MSGLTMKELFEECQHNVTSHPKLIRSLTKILNKQDTKVKVDQFADQYLLYTKHSLVVWEHAPAVDRTLDFIATFITSIDSEATDEGFDTDDDEATDGEMDSLRRYFVRRCHMFFLEYHDVKSQAVRYRICQLITKVLSMMSDEAKMNATIFAKLQAAMIQRLRDKVTIVRTQAAQALFRLQDSSDDHCPVIRALFRHLNGDPQPEVRRAILKSLLPSSKALILVLQRTMDVKEAVRKEAYEFLALKVHVRSLTISQRIKLLRQGLNDRSESVQKICKETLLPAWSRMLDDDLLAFVRSLDAHMAPDVTEVAIKELLAKKCSQEFVDSFVSDFLDHDRVIRDDLLYIESVFLWRVVCDYLKNLGGRDEDLLEKIMPDLPKFCLFIKKNVQSFEENDDVMELVDKEFTIEQMILITHLYDLVDETHRKCFYEMAKYLIEMPKVGEGIVVLAVKILKTVIPNSLDRALYLMEAITEIREPIDVVEVGLTLPEQRSKELKVAKLRVELNVAREDLETFVSRQDFERAQMAKGRLNELEVMLMQVTEKSPQTQEVRLEKSDDFTLIKCLALVSEILKDTPFKLDDDRLHSLVDNIILPSVRTESEIVRHCAVRALGLACFVNVDLASQHFLLFLQISQIDAEEVRLIALKIVFDLVMLNGLDMKTTEESQLERADADETLASNSESDSGDMSDSSGKLLSILLKQLDSEVLTVNTLGAEGISKLLLASRVVSPKTVSRLIIMWFSPVHQDNEYLISCLGVFFPLFAGASAANRAMIAGAFMPTLRTLFRAPASSPLSIINVASVGNFLVQLTIMPKKQQQNLEPNLHDGLSIAVCNEILHSPKHFGVATLVDVLRQLRISRDKYSLLKNLAGLCSSILKKVKDKRTVLKLKKFSADVDALLSKIVTGEEVESGEEGCSSFVPESPPVCGKRMSFTDSEMSEEC